MIGQNVLPIKSEMHLGTEKCIAEIAYEDNTVLSSTRKATLMYIYMHCFSLVTLLTRDKQ